MNYSLTVNPMHLNVPRNIIAFKPRRVDNDGAVILRVITHANPKIPTEYVTHIMEIASGNMYHGHYFNDLATALQDFNTRD